MYTKEKTHTNLVLSSQLWENNSKYTHNTITRSYRRNNCNSLSYNVGIICRVWHVHWLYTREKNNIEIILLSSTWLTGSLLSGVLMLAKIRKRPASAELVIHIFSPLSTQLSPSLTAEASRANASEPELASDNAKLANYKIYALMNVITSKLVTHLSKVLNVLHSWLIRNVKRVL